MLMLLRKASGPSAVCRTGSRSSNNGRSVRRQKMPDPNLVASLETTMTVGWIVNAGGCEAGGSLNHLLYRQTKFSRPM